MGVLDRPDFIRIRKAPAEDFIQTDSEVAHIGTFDPSGRQGPDIRPLRAEAGQKIDVERDQLGDFIEPQWIMFIGISLVVDCHAEFLQSPRKAGCAATIIADNKDHLGQTCGSLDVLEKGEALDTPESLLRGHHSGIALIRDREGRL